MIDVDHTPHKIRSMILIAVEVDPVDPTKPKRSDIFEFEGRTFYAYARFDDMVDFEVAEKVDYYLLFQEERDVILYLLEGEITPEAVIIHSAVLYSEIANEL